MHIFGLVLFALVAAFWIFHGLQTAIGASQLSHMKRVDPAADASCSSISLIFAARDEAAKLPAALATLAALDYPELEIIAVDDRSADATGPILDAFAMQDSRARVVHLTELPAGWLGKPHALQQGYEVSSGQWIVFTDADVKFAANVLRRAMALVLRNHLDHLTLIADLEMHGFWEHVAITFFGLAFYLGSTPHRIADGRSGAYAGVGAFQMLQRSVYEKIGAHRRLAMEVVDDMKVGKLVKLAGFRSGIAVSGDLVSVRWQSGLGNVVRGVTKNFFAAFGYSLPFASAAVAAMFSVSVLPFLAIWFVHGWTLIFCVLAVAIALLMHGGVSLTNRASPLYALTHPLGALLFCYMIVRSVAVTLWQGGVTWRGTFYPLKELRKGVV